MSVSKHDSSKYSLSLHFLTTYHICMYVFVRYKYVNMSLMILKLSNAFAKGFVFAPKLLCMRLCLFDSGCEGGPPGTL